MDIIKMKKFVTMEWTKSTKGTQVYSCSDTNTPVSITRSSSFLLKKQKKKVI